MTHHPGTSSWFLAQLKPNSHRIAERNLARQGFCTFLPVQEETRRRSGRFLTALKPLFPGYIFVGFDTALGGWHAVNATQGITRLVGFGKDPAPVPGGIVSELMCRCDAEGKLFQPEPVMPGEAVRVTTGPFADFVATVEKIAPDRRVWVLLELMGRETRIALPPDRVQPA